ncbi:ATP-binding protein [Desulfuromonas carbonis]|uniref:two-component system sensor histidine kinase NtrB n=1 Tax=Desulfuromonas sp. DDH964 TaxID=1823759 RepID=UPI00078E5FA3|nr:ATP-binding protein [Desulfuromonas sp. DDH964]AMV71807.1 sensor histidine kinase PilS, PAS domain-containing [Desulfuromonas sp. DDH964]
MAGYRGAGGHGERAEHQRLILFLVSRILVISLFLGGTIVYQFRSSLGQPPVVITYLYLLVGISYLHAVVSGFLLLRLPGRAVTQFMASWDLLLATALIYLSGGIDSLFSFLYLLIIVTVSLLLPRRDVVFVACASAILYGSLLDLQYFGLLHGLPGLDFAHRTDGRDVFYAVFINVTGFLLTALLAGALSERLQRSQQALEQKEIDYEELENLNRSIQATIHTGLMVVNRSGRIRLFNQAAERMTGYTLHEVYNLDIRQLIPEMAVIGESGLQEISRGQTSFSSRDGQRKIFGFASSRVENGREGEGGLLVVFQDLTQVLEMEERLKRADRLAAVGRLAAGMAHEIRNPLASISGSVQLMLEGTDLPEDDRRLMGIVVREADRLSALLTDFLVYARPRKPAPEHFDPALLLDEIIDMVMGDVRSSAISVERHYQARVLVELDRTMLWQIFWDLLINAVEAMPEGGRLRVTMTVEQAGLRLAIEDSGPGIPAREWGRIFEPFFTTKAQGTGLGLATVFSLVEVNGGTIHLEAGSLGGACFVLHFPLGPDQHPNGSEPLRLQGQVDHEE